MGTLTLQRFRAKLCAFQAFCEAGDFERVFRRPYFEVLVLTASATRLEHLLTEFGAERVARKVMVVEYFPYHSETFRSFPVRLDSQHYSADLIREAMARVALVISIRAWSWWTWLVRELLDYPVHRLHSPQNVKLTAANCPTDFEELRQVLAAP